MISFLKFLKQSLLIDAEKNAGHPERLDFKAWPFEAMSTKISFHDPGHLGIFP
jgi:hypothetical protein